MIHDDFIFGEDIDTLYLKSDGPRPFIFNQEVSSVFDNMALRSIPLYLELNECILSWAYKVCQPETNLIDVGCSTGTILKSLRKELPPSVKLFGIDNSPFMIELAKKKNTSDNSANGVELINADLRSYCYSNASLILANYVLQFLPLEDRLAILKKFADALVPAGALILSEKVRFTDPSFTQSADDIYYKLKETNGYSKVEILRKKNALNKVMLTMSTDDNIQMLKSAGFKSVEMILRWHHFTTFIAFK